MGGGRKKGRKAKAPKGKWRKTFRMINGERRAVKVKRNADGTESVKLLAPRN